MKNPKRTRVAEGIYQDACGFLVSVCVKGHRRGKRFPPDTALAFMAIRRLRMRADLAEEDEGAPAIPVPVRGPFARDLDRYLPQIAGRVGYKADRSHLHAWLPHIGATPRSRVTPAQVRTAIATWLQAGKSARTIRHRVRVLREMWQTLDGKQAKPPLEGVKLPRPADPHPTPVPLEIIQRVAASLKAGKRHKEGYGGDSDKCHARFLVRATTGQRPSQIMRAEPDDLDLARRIWFVRAGKGGTAIPLPLNADQVHAWRAFIAADAWGKFDTRSFSKTIRRHGWPAGIRPYTLRHTFAIDHLLGGTDLGDLQGLLGHRQIETTRKHYAPVLLARLKKAGASRKLKLV